MVFFKGKTTATKPKKPCHTNMLGKAPNGIPLRHGRAYGGTNNKGHFIHGRYYLLDNIQARGTAFFTERESESKDGKRDENRLQLDMFFNF